MISPFIHQNESQNKFAERILPETSLFMQMADFLYRIEREIIPALKQGHIVLLDRGIQTLIVRGLMIGMSETQIYTGLLWWRNSIYKELFDNAKTIYFTANADESLRRLQKRTLKEYREMYGKKLAKTKYDGTLLTLHFINTLVYAADGKKMTRNDKKAFIRDTQNNIIETYKRVFQDETGQYIELDGMLGKQKLASILKKHVVDMLI